MKKLFLFVLLAAAAYFLYKYISPNSDLVTRQNFQSLALGMSETAARNILGQPYAVVENQAATPGSPLDSAWSNLESHKAAIDENPLMDEVITLMNYVSDTKRRYAYLIFSTKDCRNLEGSENLPNCNDLSIASVATLKNALNAELEEYENWRKKEKQSIRLNETRKARILQTNILTVGLIRDGSCFGMIGAVVADSSSVAGVMSDPLFGAIHLEECKILGNEGKSVLHQVGKLYFDLPASACGNPQIRGRLLMWKGDNGDAIYAVTNPDVTFLAYSTNAEGD